MDWFAPYFAALTAAFQLVPFVVATFAFIIGFIAGICAVIALAFRAGLKAR